MAEPQGSTTTVGARHHLLDKPSSDVVGVLARRGASWTFALTIASQLMTVVTTAVLARFLLPGDYGIIGMVATLTGLLSVFAGLGLSLSTIQRPDLTIQQVHNIFWINTIAGFVFWVVCIAAAPALAAFYNEPRLVRLTIVLGASFAIGGLGEQSRALLQRSMKFRQITFVQLAVQAVGSILVVWLAIAGWGYWALVARALVSGVLGVVLAFWVSGYRPGRFSRNVETWPLVTFGGFVAISSIVTYFSQNTDNIIVGRLWGTETLGFYSRAYFLMTLPTLLFSTSVSGVMFPALSALAGEPGRQAEAFGKTLRAIAYGGAPAAVGLTIVAPEAVRLIYGPEWSPVVPILAWLSVTMLTSVIGSSAGWLYMAHGRTGTMLLSNVVSTMFLVALIGIGASFGVNGIAAGHAVHGVVALVPSMYLAHRICAVPFPRTIRTLLPILSATVAMGMVAFGAGWIVDALWLSWQATLAAKVTAGLVTYGILSYRWLRPIAIPMPGWVLARLGRFGVSLYRGRA